MPEFPLVALSPQPFAHRKYQAQMAEIPAIMRQGFAELMAALAKVQAEPAGMPLCHYTGCADNSAAFELGFPVAENDVETVRSAGLEIGDTASGTVMKAVHFGPYEGLSNTYEAMSAVMKEKGLTAGDELWEAYFSPPGAPPQEARTEIYWPVETPA